MRKKRGFSLVETMLSVVVIGMVITTAAQLTMSVGRSFIKTSTQLDVDQHASLGVQWMTRDLQEAKQVEIQSPTHIRVRYPVQLADGSYNRLALDATRMVDYYRGDKNGDEDAQGSYLIRDAWNEAPRVICDGIETIDFHSFNPSSVDVTLGVRKDANNRTSRCEMIHRAIFMRNY
jgi:prepilin-type N-terminal cleavage/methylation domain-containing protein